MRVRLGTKLRACLAAVAVLGATAAMAAGGSGAAFADTTAPGGTWGSAQAIPGVDALVYTGGGYDPSSVSNIGCSTPGNCVAIGNYDGPDNTSPAPFVATEVNGTWGTKPLAGLPAEAVSSTAYHAGVSCGQPDFCTVFGTYAGTDDLQLVFAVTETGGTWGTPDVLDATALGSVQSFNDSLLSCPAAGECTLIGSYGTTSGTGGSFTADESGGNWGSVQPFSLASLQPAGYSDVTGSLDELSCGAPGDCTASGLYEGTPYQYNTNPQPFTVTEAGHTWGAPQPVPGLASLSPNGADSARGNVNEITSISCPDAGDCAAVGTFYPQPDSAGSLFTLDEAGGTWGQAQAFTAWPSDVTAGGSSGYVSCRSAGDCVIATTVAVAPGATEAVTASESGSGSWGTATAIPGDGDSTLSGITCVPAGDCTVYGTDHPGGTYLGRIFSATEADGAAMETEQQVLTLPSGGKLSNLGMACPQNGQCTAVFNDQNPFAAYDIPQVVAEGTPVTAGPVPTVTLTVPSTIYYGQSLNLTVTVSSAGDTPLGTVSVTSSAGPICTIRLAGGTGSCPLSGAYLFLGADTLTAAYPGDPEHQPATGTAAITYDQNATVAHLAFTPGSVTFTGAGTTLTVSGTVSSAVGTPSGIATVLVDGKAVSGCTNALVDLTGKLSCQGTTGVLSAGRHLVTLSYPAEGGFLASTSAPVPLTVSKRGTATTLALAKTSVTYGHESAERFTVSVSRAGSVYPTGKVAVRIGGTTICTITLSKGIGSCLLANTRLRAGTYTLAALYSGDGNYAPSWSAKKILKVAA